MEDAEVVAESAFLLGVVLVVLLLNDLLLLLSLCNRFEEVDLENEDGAFSLSSSSI